MKKLTYEEIRSVLRGAVRVEQTPTGIRPHKLTERQIAAYDKIHENLGRCARATTGIRLDFTTDSTTLRFTASCGDRFELLVNGLLVKQWMMDDLRANGEAPTYDLGHGSKRVVLAFPNHTPGELCSLELDDGATLHPTTEYARRMIFVGDSITQGAGASFSTLSYAWRTALYYDADFYVQGVGGAGFSEMTYDDEAIPADFEADTVFIAFGTNDLYRYPTLDDIALHADRHIACLQARWPNARHVAITPLWRTDIAQRLPGGTLTDVIPLIEQAARANGFEIVNGMTLVPHMSEFFSDGLHPNDVGHGLYAQHLIRTLERGNTKGGQFHERSF